MPALISRSLLLIFALTLGACASTPSTPDSPKANRSDYQAWLHKAQKRLPQMFEAMQKTEQEWGSEPNILVRRFEALQSKPAMAQGLMLEFMQHRLPDHPPGSVEEARAQTEFLTDWLEAALLVREISANPDLYFEQMRRDLVQAEEQGRQGEYDLAIPTLKQRVADMDKTILLMDGLSYMLSNMPEHALDLQV